MSVECSTVASTGIHGFSLKTENGLAGQGLF